MKQFSIGIGTYRLTPEQCYEMVLEGLRLGYRHIDTAALYKNEEAVGKAIRDFISESGGSVTRQELFLTTKVHRRKIIKAKIQEGVLESLEKLGTYIDLVLLHNVTDNFQWAWSELQQIKQWEGVREVGVSNFRIQELEVLRPKPAFNQIECTPFIPRCDLVEYCARNSIKVVAHSPLVKGERFDHPKLLELSGKLQVTPAQLLLAWSLQKGYMVLPRTSISEHLVENKSSNHCIPEQIMSELEKLEDGYATHPKLL